MNIHALIDQINQLGEQEKIEVKTGKEIGKSILETVCAFANEPDLGGGCLLLGIQEMNHFERPYNIVGVTQPEQLIENLVSQCRSTFNSPINIDVSQKIVNGKIVVGVFVPEADSGNKPIYFKNLGLPRGAFRRMGSSDVQCTEDDLFVLFKNRNTESYDYSILADADWNDISQSAIDDYRRERTAIHPNAKELRWSDEELLQSIGCLKNENGKLKPTVAGILLFGTSTALRRIFPAMRVDYIREPGTRWISDIKNRYTAVEIRAPIMESIRRALSAIIDDLPKAFSLPEGSIQREDIPVIPIAVIREAVVNALMHRNYRVGQAIQIIRYANRIEIRNPGYSLIAEDHLGEPGSKSRNLKIAEMLHETRFAEVKGSGIRTMRENMHEAGLSPPLFESSRTRDLFIATFLFHHFLGKEDIHWLSQFKADHLSDEQARALIFVREVGAIDNSAYRNLNQVDTLTASVSLRRLRDLELLCAKNQGVATYYVPGQMFINSLSKEHQLEGKEHQVMGKGHQLEGKEHQLQGGVGGSTLPLELQERLQRLGKKSTEIQLRDVILSLCGWKEMTASELANFLKRDKKRLVRKFLSIMVKEKVLEYKYPQMPGHPGQTYRRTNVDFQANNHLK